MICVITSESWPRQSKVTGTSIGGTNAEKNQTKPNTTAKKRKQKNPEPKANTNTGTMLHVSKRQKRFVFQAGWAERPGSEHPPAKHSSTRVTWGASPRIPQGLRDHSVPRVKLLCKHSDNIHRTSTLCPFWVTAHFFGPYEMLCVRQSHWHGCSSVCYLHDWSKADENNAFSSKHLA